MKVNAGVLLLLILKSRRKNIVGILYQRYNIITIEYADDLNLLGKTTGHDRKSREAEEPIIGVAYGVMQGNLHASHKALPGGGFFVFMNRKRIEKHIEQNDYFGTLATVLDLACQTLERDKKGLKPNWQIKLLKSLKDDLVFLQENYKIVKKIESNKIIKAIKKD
jgi:hypothetical protein